MPEYIGLDFETYGATSLKTRGLHNYVSCSTFTPLRASIALPRPGAVRTTSLDMVREPDARDRLADALEDKIIAAHNAGFEQRVLAALGIDIPSTRFVDTAVISRALGAGSSLEAAAPQLLGTDKLEDGRRLIQLFSIPGKYQEANDCLAFDPQIIEDHPGDWDLFGEYCDIDAELGLRIAMLPEAKALPFRELKNMAVTMDMNVTGWPVDVAMVEEMQRRYLENREVALAEFRALHDPKGELNLASLKQLKEWCAARGIKATSFDEKNVDKLVARIEQRLNDSTKLIAGTQHDNYSEVLALLKTKQILGGSSLKKLQTILDITGKDCRLRDQYLHVGAGQSFRTSGRGVQMQNLKRLGPEPDDMAELEDLDCEWDNDKLARNLRQVFTSSHPDGQLIVGDFSSVESRGLAWLAGEQWKLDSYAHGQDLYKVLAAKIYGADYYDVTKTQRQTGKVGELSCGYGAGSGAVQAFAENMGTPMTEGEAAKLVTDWRLANPLIVKFWWALDDALNAVLDDRQLATLKLGPVGAFKLRVFRCETPESLLMQHPKAQSIAVEMSYPDGAVMLTRYFHGCYRRGKDICYYKPSERKTGDLWRRQFTDPKTKQVRFYSIYGGKLAGILTQSFCRELFFDSLRKVHEWAKDHGNVDLVGQFHDEIVLDWWPAPAAIDLLGATTALNQLMTDCSIPGFPMAAEVKSDYRYTK